MPVRGRAGGSRPRALQKSTQCVSSADAPRGFLSDSRAGPGTEMAPMMGKNPPPAESNGARDPIGGTHGGLWNPVPILRLRYPRIGVEILPRPSPHSVLTLEFHRSWAGALPRAGSFPPPSSHQRLWGRRLSARSPASACALGMPGSLGVLGGHLLLSTQRLPGSLVPPPSSSLSSRPKTNLLLERSNGVPSGHQPHIRQVSNGLHHLPAKTLISRGVAPSGPGTIQTLVSPLPLTAAPDPLSVPHVLPCPFSPAGRPVSPWSPCLLICSPPSSPRDPGDVVMPTLAGGQAGVLTWPLSPYTPAPHLCQPGRHRACLLASASSPPPRPLPPSSPLLLPVTLTCHQP